MAPSNPASDPAHRYSELELAYTEDRWADVLADGQTLIDNLQSSRDPRQAGLRSRAQLLLGHAQLYGLGNPAAARPYYEAVLRGASEPELRQIAEAALPYCQRSEPAEPATSQGIGVADSAGATTITEAPTNMVPVGDAAIEDPEESAPAALANPFQAEASAGLAPEDASVASLAATAAAAIDTSPKDKGRLDATPNLAADQDLEASSWQPGSPSLDGDDRTVDPFEMALAAVVSQTGTPRVNAESRDDAAPWLADQARLKEEMATISQRRRGTSIGAELGLGSGGLDLESVELVEEPEQLAVAQADPSRAEEITVEVAESTTELDLSQEDPELVAGLLRVVLRS